MIKEFKKELLLSIVLVGIIFYSTDLFGDFLVPDPDSLVLSSGLMIAALLFLILPSLIGTIPSGFLIARKGASSKTSLFVPAIGAAIAVLIIMIASAIALAIMPDALWQEQIAQLAELDISFFNAMSLEEFKAITMVSLLVGAVFMAVFNFAVGLAGGYIGKTMGSKKTAVKGPRPKK